VTLKCYDPKEVISEIQFASYGTPTGVCGSYLRSACDALNATEYIIQACVGNSNCTIPASPTFGVPCTSPNIKLVIQAVCTGSNGGYGKPSETPMIQGVIDGKTGNKKILIVNVKNVPVCVTIPGASGSTIFTIDESVGDGPARKDLLTSSTFTLAPFAVSVLLYTT